MNKKLTSVTIIVLILVLIGYILIDVGLKRNKKDNIPVSIESPEIGDQWIVTRILETVKGQLNAVSVSEDGKIITGGEPFIACYDPDLKLLWENNTVMPVSALAVYGNYIYAAVQNFIMVFNMQGENIDEWGPFEENAIISSLTANESYVSFADAGNRLVYVLDKNGVLRSMMGNSGEPFYIPSPYFDIALGDDNILYAANTGNRRIDKRNIDGTLIGYFGEAGTDPGDFCGCCNPAHFILVPGGFVTAEKGINRVTKLNENGEFVEFVSSVNRFIPALPLDIASYDGETIYAANPADSKVYVFTRK